MLSTFKYLKVLDPGLIKTCLVETKCISWELLDQSFICSFNNELLSEDNHYWVTFMLLFSQFYVLLVSTSPQRVCSLWFLSMWSFNMIPLQQFHTTLTALVLQIKHFQDPGLCCGWWWGYCVSVCWLSLLFLGPTGVHHTDQTAGDGERPHLTARHPPTNTHEGVR